MTEKSRRIVRKTVKYLLIALAIFFANVIVPRLITSPKLGGEDRFSSALEKYRRAHEDIDRFYALGDLAKESFHTGRFDEARKHAAELETLTPEFTGNWNYGNAIQDFNIVQGLLALRNGDREAAKKHLTAAGDSPGSPQMNSFGPNMCLAKALLEAGERGAVLAYFEQCRRFWTSEHNKLDRWKWMVTYHFPPDFGANLVF